MDNLTTANDTVRKRTHSSLDSSMTQIARVTRIGLTRACVFRVCTPRTRDVNTLLRGTSVEIRYRDSAVRRGITHSILTIAWASVCTATTRPGTQAKSARPSTTQDAQIVVVVVVMVPMIAYAVGLDVEAGRCPANFARVPRTAL